MLEFVNFSASYSKKKILENINFSLNENSVISILGANGSGKSTFLKSLMGIKKYSGDIYHDGKNLNDFNSKQRAQTFSYVPQHINIPFEFSVLDIVLMGRFHESSFGLSYTKNDYLKAKDALHKVGALKFENRIFKDLSGGEKQLVFLARALAANSKIIVLDEPTTGLDLGNQMKILELMNELKETGKTIIQTTHYPDHALRISDIVVWLHNKTLFAFGSAKDVITQKRISEVYGIDSAFYEYKDKYQFVLPLELIK